MRRTEVRGVRHTAAVAARAVAGGVAHRARAKVAEAVCALPIGAVSPHPHGVADAIGGQLALVARLARHGHALLEVARGALRHGRRADHARRRPVARLRVARGTVSLGRAREVVDAKAVLEQAPRPTARLVALEHGPLPIGRPGPSRSTPPSEAGTIRTRRRRAPPTCPAEPRGRRCTRYSRALKQRARPTGTRGKPSIQPTSWQRHRQ